MIIRVSKFALNIIIFIEILSVFIKLIYQNFYKKEKNIWVLHGFYIFHKLKVIFSK